MRVSIHAPARGATHWLRPWTASQWFQSTRPRGARLTVSIFVMTSAMFQSTRPRGARPPRGHSVSRPLRFNPRARAGRDAAFAVIGDVEWLFQSTRPRGARRDICRIDESEVEVSIHAPARGATHVLQARAADREVSIHAPARGATFDTE